MTSLKQFVLAIAVISAAHGVAARGQTQPATGPTTQRYVDEISLSVRPMSLGGPLGSVTLRPNPADSIKGNAALHYLRAFVSLRDNRDINQLVDEILDFNGPKEDAIPAIVAKRGTTFDTSIPDDLLLGNRCTECDWGLPIRERTFDLDFGYSSTARHMSNVLAAKGRLALAQNDVPQAVRILSAMMVFADRIDEGQSILPTHLLSIGTTQIALELLERLMQRDEAPNFYWALQAIPVPASNFSASIANDFHLLEMAFPELAECAVGRDLSTAQVGVIVDRLNAVAERFRKINKADPTYLVRATPLPAPSPEAFRRFYLSYRSRLDGLIRAAELPYPQAHLRIVAAAAAYDRLASEEPNNPFYVAPLKTTYRWLWSSVALDRHIAILATVEALRAHAGSHDGQLPAALADLTDCPAPNNPVTGLPFAYTRESPTTATLEDTSPQARRQVVLKLSIRR